MTKTKKSKSDRSVAQSTNNDGLYLLKLVLYMILGLQWLWINLPSGSSLPIPIGLLLGVGFASHDHFQIDRKIEYALLLAAMLVGFMAHVGISVNLT